MARGMELRRQVEAALQAIGLPWALDEGGQGHIKIKLAGKLVGIMPRAATTNPGRAAKNVLGQIRRAALGHQTSLTRQ